VSALPADRVEAQRVAVVLPGGICQSLATTGEGGVFAMTEQELQAIAERLKRVDGLSKLEGGDA